MHAYHAAADQMVADIGHNGGYIVCVVSSSVLKIGSLVDHLSGTEGKYLSIANRKRALSADDISVSASCDAHKVNSHCFGVTIVGSPRAAPPKSLTQDSSFLSLR